MDEVEAFGHRERWTVKMRHMRAGARRPVGGRSEDGVIGLFAGERVELASGEVKLVGTGFAVELPRGTEGQVRAERRLAAEYGVAVLNSPGTVDSGYRGEVGVILVNHGARSVKVERGMQVAELAVRRVVEVEVVEADALSVAERGRTGSGLAGSNRSGAGQGSRQASAGGAAEVRKAGSGSSSRKARWRR